MAVGATFEPHSAPGEAGDRFFRGYQQGSNLMERAQRRRWQQEDRDYQNQIRAKLEPSMFAKAAADEATANATLINFERSQQLRQRFGLEAPAAQLKYEAAMSLPTYEEQAKALSRLQQEYHWMGLIDEGKGFVDQLNNTRLSTSQFALADIKLTEAQEVARRQQQDQMERIRARGQEERRTAEVTGRGKTPEERWMTALEQARVEGDQEEIAFYTDRLNRARRERPVPGAGARIDDINERIRRAETEGRPQDAADLRRARDNELAPKNQPLDINALAAAFEGGAAPAATAPAAPVAPPAPAPAAPAKLYTVDAENNISIPAGTSPEDTIRAFNQMVKDNVLDADEARKRLDALGFKRKK